MKRPLVKHKNFEINESDIKPLTGAELVVLIVFIVVVLAGIGLFMMTGGEARP